MVTESKKGQKISPKAVQSAEKSAKRKSTRNLQYKEPELWIRQGRNAQFGTPGREKRFITVGIDFGTAFTKASVGLMDKIYIVDWSGLLDSPNPFTLPCEMSVLGNNYCVLGHAAKARQVFRQLKHPFLQDNPSGDQIALGTAFLALVLRYVRAWLFYRHGKLIQNKKAIWSLNIGMPSKPFESSELKNIYEGMARSAWDISCQGKPITIQGAKLARANEPNQGIEDFESVKAIPEFVAQIASYVHSPQRQGDLHMIMDVGAGTVDVATFNVHENKENGENVFPIFSSEVKPLGTHFLTESRISFLSRKKPIEWNDFSPILSAADFCKKFKVDIEQINKCDDVHASQVSNTIGGVLHHTRTKRYRNSPNWNNGIRVFFCGGGSENDVFQKALKMSFGSNQSLLKQTPLPFPENAEAKGLDKKDFHRVAVAYGLGINAWNLGTIRPAAEVADDKPVWRSVRERPDRDELYPK